MTQASEARVVCRDLLTLHQADNAAPSPAAAAGMWSLFLSRYVPRIRHTALRSLASDYALTAKSNDDYNAAPLTSVDDVNPSVEEKRDADVASLAHALCYDVDTALYKPANTP
jgi:hypothetical protein